MWHFSLRMCYHPSYLFIMQGGEKKSAGLYLAYKNVCNIMHWMECLAFSAGMWTKRGGSLGDFLCSCIAFRYYRVIWWDLIDSGLLMVVLHGTYLKGVLLTYQLGRGLVFSLSVLVWVRVGFILRMCIAIDCPIIYDKTDFGTVYNFYYS